MALMENPAPREREEFSHHLRQLPDSSTFLQDLTTRLDLPALTTVPTPFSTVLGDAELSELTLDERHTQPGRSSHAAKLPVELLCFIFEILAARREALELKNCGSTCRVSRFTRVVVWKSSALT